MYIHVFLLFLFVDLMLPGVVQRCPVTPNTYRHVHKGQQCSVNLAGNRYVSKCPSCCLVFCIAMLYCRNNYEVLF